MTTCRVGFVEMLSPQDLAAIRLIVREEIAAAKTPRPAGSETTAPTANTRFEARVDAVMFGDPAIEARWLFEHDGDARDAARRGLRLPDGAPLTEQLMIEYVRQRNEGYKQRSLRAAETRRRNARAKR